MNWNTGLPNHNCRCLVKTLTDQFIRLDYVNSRWEYPDSHIEYSSEDSGQITGWELVSSIDSELTDHTKYWAYNFNTAFIESAVPALKLWIEKGCSHPAGIDHDIWNNIKRTILSAFIEYAKFEDGQYNDLSQTERDIKWKEIKKLIRVAFNLIGEYFEDMWD